MSYLLWHSSTSGQIGLPAKSGHMHRGGRVYHHDGHFIEIDGKGFDPYEDVEEILKIPGYRLATPEEQDRYYASKRQTSAIHEGPTATEEHAETVEEKHTDAPARKGRRDK